MESCSGGSAAAKPRPRQSSSDSVVSACAACDSASTGIFGLGSTGDDDCGVEVPAQLATLLEEVNIVCECKAHQKICWHGATREHVDAHSWSGWWARVRGSESAPETIDRLKSLHERLLQAQKTYGREPLLRDMILGKRVALRETTQRLADTSYADKLVVRKKLDMLAQLIDVSLPGSLRLYKMREEPAALGGGGAHRSASLLSAQQASSPPAPQSYDDALPVAEPGASEDED